MSTAHRYGIKVDGSVAIISIKSFPICLHVMYLYFPDTPHRKTGVDSDGITSKVVLVSGYVCPDHVVERQNWLCFNNGVNKLVIV
jgi:hypothetical protein